MGLQVWLPLNKDTNVIPGISSFSKEGSVTLTADTDGWYKVQDSSHTSSRWGIYYDFNVKPSTTYTLTVYSKSTTGVSCSIGIGSFPGAVTWPAVRDTNNTSTEKLTTYTWTTTQNDRRARIYLAMNPGSTVANNYVFYKEPRVCEAFTNQGLSSDVTITNNGATAYDNGKIGKCYYFNGVSTSSGNTIYIPQLTIPNTFSVSGWFKLVASVGSGSAEYLVCLNNNAYSGDMQFAIAHRSKGLFVIVNNTEYTIQSLELDTWYHIALTFNGTYAKVYINGNEVNSRTVTSTAYTGHNFNIGSRSSATDGSTHSYYSKIYTNDVRLYDNALSPQEVKEISRALVVHYPLDRNGWGQDNIASKYVVPGSNAPTTTTTAGRTVYIGDYGIKIPATENADTYFSIYYSNPIESGKTYTLSGNVSGIVSGTYYRFPLFQQSNTSMGVWQLDHNGVCSLTFTMNYTGTIPTSTVSGVTYYRMFMDDSGRNIASGQGDIIISNIKLEEGSKVTNWIPNVNDSLYQTMNVPSTVEYDISGYQNNGTRKNTFTYTTNSSKYKLATIFNGSNNSIAAGQGAKVKDAITISCWGYMNSWSSYNGRLLSCTEGGGWNFEPSSGKMNFAMGTGASSNTYKSVTSTTTLTQLGSGWHMFTGTYDGFNTKIYIDGVLENTNAAYTTKTPIYYLAANGIFVGAEAAGSATDPTGSYFNGYLSDVRIYATALSADDILELYNNKVI